MANREVPGSADTRLEKTGGSEKFNKSIEMIRSFNQKNNFPDNFGVGVSRTITGADRKNHFNTVKGTYAERRAQFENDQKAQQKYSENNIPTLKEKFVALQTFEFTLEGVLYKGVRICTVLNGSDIAADDADEHSETLLFNSKENAYFLTNLPYRRNRAEIYGRIEQATVADLSEMLNGKKITTSSEVNEFYKKIEEIIKAGNKQYSEKEKVKIRNNTQTSLTILDLYINPDKEQERNIA